MLLEILFSEEAKMISLIFFFLAAVCNAVMDICSHHFYDSIFYSRKFSQRWWDAQGSWRNKYIGDDPHYGRKKIKGTNINKFVQFSDAWHFFKMWMIIFLAAFGVAAHYNMTIGRSELKDIVLWIIAYGTVWNCTFSLFYSKILRR